MIEKMLEAEMETVLANQRRLRKQRELAIKMFRAKMPFDVFSDEPECENPIRFKHDAKSRKELLKERSTEEMLDIIEKCNLRDRVLFAIANCDNSFFFYPEYNSIAKDEFGYFLTDEFEEECGPHIEDKGMIAQIENLSLDLLHVISYDYEDEECYILCTFETQEDELEFMSRGFSYYIIPYYIKETNVNTLHKLGKLINEGSQWFTDIDDYYDPFDVDFGWEDFNLEDPFLV